jgi:hypothetical protein
MLHFTLSLLTGPVQLSRRIKIHTSEALHVSRLNWLPSSGIQDLEENGHGLIAALSRHLLETIE